MKNLNRKAYKKTIREFRKSCPISQIQNKWVSLVGENGERCLMFVHGSIIKRGNPQKTWDKYHCFAYNNFYFRVILYGSKSLIWDDFKGVTIERYFSRISVVQDRLKFRVLEESELGEEYDKIFDRAKKYHRYIFTKKN